MGIWHLNRASNNARGQKSTLLARGSICIGGARVGIMRWAFVFVSFFFVWIDGMKCTLIIVFWFLYIFEQLCILAQLHYLRPIGALRCMVGIESVWYGVESRARREGMLMSFCSASSVSWQWRSSCSRLMCLFVHITWKTISYRFRWFGWRGRRCTIAAVDVSAKLHVSLMEMVHSDLGLGTVSTIL